MPKCFQLLALLVDVSSYVCFPALPPTPMSSCPTMNLCGFYYRIVRVCLKMLTHIHFQKSDLIPHYFSAGEVYLV